MQLNLSKFLLRYRTTPHTTSGKSPAELIFRRQIKTRFDLLHPTEIKQKLPTQKDQSTFPNKFQIDQKVWVSNYHGSPRWLPGIITQTVGTCNYQVKVKGQIWKRHDDQLWLRRMKVLPSEDRDNFSYDDFPSAEQPLNVCEQQGTEFIVPSTRRYPLRSNRRPPDKLHL